MLTPEARPSATPAEAPAGPERARPAQDAAPTPGAPGRFSRRATVRLIGAALLVALLLPGVLWLELQRGHIVTRNAMVRSHLTELGVRTEGVVREIFVAAGDEVREGDLLLRLDDRHLRARLAQARADAQALREELRMEQEALRVAERRAEIAVRHAEAELSRRAAEWQAARSRADQARATHRARETLLAERAVSPEVVRDADATARTAAALAEAAAAAEGTARATLEEALLEVEAVAVARARLRVLDAERERAEAAVALVEADIASARVHAPADGAIVRRLAQPGMAVATGTPLLSMWLSGATWVEAWVDEAALGDLREGSAAQVSFPALPGQRFAATVSKIGLATDFEMPVDYLPRSRAERMRHTPLVGVALTLEAPPRLLRPGVSAIVDIERGGS